LSRCVVDASVAVKWYLPEIHADAAARWLARDAAFLAPDLIYAEFGNVLWKRARSGELSRSEARAIARAFRLVPVEVHPCEALMEPALEIACALGRSLYDCLYLAVAVLRDCPLVTADRGLYDAIRGTGIADSVRWVEETP
jgi:predicted nucleic acid-binding protein